MLGSSSGYRLLFPRIFFSLSEALGKVQSEVLPVTLSDKLAGALQARFCITLHRSPLCPRQLDLKSAPVKGNERISRAFKNTIGFSKTLAFAALLCLFSLLLSSLQHFARYTFLYTTAQKKRERKRTKIKILYTFLNYYTIILLNLRTHLRMHFPNFDKLFYCFQCFNVGRF